MNPFDHRENSISAMIRAKVEYQNMVIRRKFSHVKNRSQLFMLGALGNQFLVKRKLAESARIA